jgi:membrane protein required for colicin V production
MNGLDIILLIIIIAAAIGGFSKGFFAELASVVSIVLGIWAALKLYEIVQRWLSHIIHWGASSLKLFSFILVFIVVIVIVHLIAKVFDNTIKAIALGIFGRLAGAILGALKGAFILSILLIVVAKIEYYTTTIIPEKTKKESKLYGPIDNFAPNILPFLRDYKETAPQSKGNVV